jgi:hypothetical protein
MPRGIRTEEERGKDRVGRGTIRKLHLRAAADQRYQNDASIERNDDVNLASKVEV